MIITFISDTHSLHNNINLPGGDLIIHAGDFSSRGYKHELKNFLKWFSKLNYDEKIFISGNHDWNFQDNPEISKNLVNEYKEKGIIYLQDDHTYIGDYPDLIKIYGTPWQPFFLNWAFNLPRNGQELKNKWDNIPQDTDILITHGPPFGHLDKVINKNDNLGCELLNNRVNTIKPKIHIFGHIHTGYGYKLSNGTHFINASVLNEQYYIKHNPITIDWNEKENIIKNFL